MSYQVIARKWRPPTFEEVIGQPHVVRTLQNAIRLERLAHAYLFTGARGVGKTSVARILAKAVNCEKGLTPTPCGQCSNCREIAQGNSAAVLEIDGASNRGIDNIRELRETVRYRPAKGRFKIYIIDEVHMLTTEAFNALLKTLEEPPEHVIFIFATTEPHKIPATILSRCQRFDFRRLSLSGIIEQLKKITFEENATLSDGVLYAIAREADGSMRDSQSLLENVLAFGGEGLSDEEILDILGVVDRRSVLRAGEAIISGNSEECLEVIEDLYRRGIDSRRFCQHLLDHFRNLLYLSVGNDRDRRLDLPEEEKKLLMEQGARTTPDSLHIYFQMLLRGEEDIRRSSMPKIALEMLLLRMARLPALESLNAIMDRIAGLEGVLKQEFCNSTSAYNRNPKSNSNPSPHDGPDPHGRPARPKGGKQPHISPNEAPERPMGGFPPSDADFVPPNPGSSEQSEVFPCKQGMDEISAQGAIEKWPEFVGFLEKREPLLWAVISHCAVRVVSDTCLELQAPDVYENTVKGRGFPVKLGGASQAFFGRGFEWVIITKEPGKKARDLDLKASGLSRGRIAAHQVVQQAIEILGAELVEVKPVPEHKGLGKKPEP